MLHDFSVKEKWDSMTRKWRDNVLLHSVRLFLIDEVCSKLGIWVTVAVI